MIISIDVRMINASGIGTYLREVLPRIIDGLPNVYFNLLGCKEELEALPWTRCGKINIIECTSPIYSIAEQLELAENIPSKTDLFWSPHYNIPLLYRGNLLVTVHDVFHLAMPQFVGGLHKRLYAKGMFMALRRKANAIISVSHFTKDEIQRLVKCDRQEIYPIYNGVDKSWYELSKYEFFEAKPYILYVGNIKPHKNLHRLLAAYKLIMNEIPHDFVIVGKKEGFITGDRLVCQLESLFEGRVQFTGYIEEARLKKYFSQATALIFPSLYEGFGLPPIEAMACGCPVVVSDIPVFKEICDGAALFCNPYSKEDIAEKIKMIACDSTLRDSLIEKGLKHARYFSWEICAAKTIDVINKVMNL